MKLTGIALSTTALLLGFYQAPFSHIHADDFDHPTATAVNHWHLHQEASASSMTLTVAPAADDDAVDVGWNVLNGSFSGITFHLAIGETAYLPPAEIASVPLPAPQTRGHDPPDRAVDSPRAPPV